MMKRCTSLLARMIFTIVLLAWSMLASLFAWTSHASAGWIIDEAEDAPGNDGRVGQGSPSND